MLLIQKGFDMVPEKVLYTIIGFLVTCLLGAVTYFEQRQVSATDHLSLTMGSLLPEIQQIKDNQENESNIRRNMADNLKSVTADVSKIKKNQVLLCHDLSMYTGWDKVNCKND